MAEPASVWSPCSTEDSHSSVRADAGVLVADANTKQQLVLDLGDSLMGSFSTPNREQEPVIKPKYSNGHRTQAHEVLAEELEQARSLVHGQRERIHHLEQALDQSLASLAELRLQLVDQQFLETQLASTEEIANIQQRAITQLKQQLAQQQQQTLEVQQFQFQEQNQSFQELLAIVEDLAQGQQTKLEQLRTRLNRDRSDTQTQQTYLKKLLNSLQTIFATQQQQRLDLQSQTVSDQTPQEKPVAASDQAQTVVQNLSQTLSEREASIHQLETELHRAHIALQEQQALIDSLQQIYSTRLNASDSPLDKELFTTHCKVQELETQISKQITSQAMLQHTCHELEQTRDRHQARIAELEEQTADMQEQILKQAQQTSEYETAIQHWKDRYLNSKSYLVKLQTLVEQVISDPSTELVELVAAIQTGTADPAESDISTSLTFPATKRGVKMDVPDFLARRHRYRARSQG